MILLVSSPQITGLDFAGAVNSDDWSVVTRAKQRKHGTAGPASMCGMQPVR
jgi:hypothetical protein